MADDGLLVNFDIGNGSFASQQNYKGGTWKDRLAAKKSSIHNRQKALRRRTQDDDSTESSRQNGTAAIIERDSRPVKKQRVEQSEASSKKQHVPSKPHQVVSSLFSFNPTSKSEPTESTETTTDANAETEPSNAPLKSELDTFTSLGLSTQLAEFLLNKLALKSPTAIQQRAVKQLIAEDTDAFIQAQTGSGKTLAYLLPIVQRLVNLSVNDSKIHRNSGLFAIILAPTRELSKQISVVLESLLRYAHWLVSGTVIGGEKKKSEKARLRKGLNILIATPGRLVDHLDNTEVLDVSSVRWLVLDEGDRLMELGFEQDIQKIVSSLNLRASRNGNNIDGSPLRRTTILCSATLKMNVQKLGDISLRNAVHIQAESNANGTTTEAKADIDRFSTPAQLQQSYIVAPAKLRLVALTALLKRSFARKGSVMKALVFMSCADSVDFHFDIFGGQLQEPTADGDEVEEVLSKHDQQIKDHRTRTEAKGISSKDNEIQIFRLHGSLPQAVRTATLSAFRTSKTPSFLVCTDVAARGLDLPNVDLVIEYDPPFQKEDHLHRIGRTARAGKDGRATIFLMPGNEEGYVDVLKSMRHEDGRNPTQSPLDDLLKRGFGSAKVGNKDWEENATDWQLKIERWILDDSKRLELARRAYQSHVRAYATHVASERQIFDMTSLHLGHLAKAFALRDKPAEIRVPGLRPTKHSADATKAERRSGARKDAAVTNSGDNFPLATDTTDASRKMREKLKQQSGASEFNLG